VSGNCTDEEPRKNSSSAYVHYSPRWFGGITGNACVIEGLCISLNLNRRTIDKSNTAGILTKQETKILKSAE
jgi:hypothetical protein